MIPDDTERNQAKRFRALDIDPSQKGVSCGLDQVPEVLDNLLHLSLDHLMGKRYELIIEIFLPLGYLCTAVEDWKIGDLFDEVLVGTRHRVVVRSCERLGTNTTKGYPRFPSLWQSSPLAYTQVCSFWLRLLKLLLSLGFNKQAYSQ